MNLSRSQTRSLISVGGAAFGLTAAYKDLRKARAKHDQLALLNAVLTVAGVLTGLAIAIRALRNGDE